MILYKELEELVDMAELCLGTVQFGMKYGINNTLGQPSEEDVFEMLDTAIENGIRIIDTARAYGTAEIILGNYFASRKSSESVKIISKLRPNIIEEDETDICGVVRKECEETLDRLRVKQLNGYLLHTPEYIYQPKIIEALRTLKEEKLVEHIGVSIYELSEGYAALKTEGIDYIQLPYSVLDQRGMQEKFIREAKKAGVAVFTRSAFLQGLFMMEKERIPDYLNHVIPYVEIFEKLLDNYSVNKVDALIQFVRQESEIDYLVFGVDTKEQLLQDISAYQGESLPKELIEELKKAFVDIEKSTIFPSLWSNGRKAD